MDFWVVAWRLRCPQLKLGVIHRKRLQRFAVATQEVHTDIFSCACLSFFGGLQKKL
jgi:hypothetical protein